MYNPFIFWSVHVLYVHRLHERCRIGYAGLQHVDFHLGRLMSNDELRAAKSSHFGASCEYDWEPRYRHPMAGKEMCNAGTEDASYATMCPMPPNRSVERKCTLHSHSPENYK